MSAYSLKHNPVLTQKDLQCLPQRVINMRQGYLQLIQGRAINEKYGYDTIKDCKYDFFNYLPKDITQKDLASFLDLFFREIAEVILTTEAGFTLPLEMGTLCIQGVKNTAYSVYQSKEKKSTIAINNDHTDGYTYKLRLLHDSKILNAAGINAQGHQKRRRSNIMMQYSFKSICAFRARTYQQCMSQQFSHWEKVEKQTAVKDKILLLAQSLNP